MLDVNPYPIVTKLLADDFDSFQSMQFCSGFQRQCVQHDGQQLSLSCFIDFEPNVAPQLVLLFVCRANVPTHELNIVSSRPEYES